MSARSAPKHGTVLRACVHGRLVNLVRLVRKDDHPVAPGLLHEQLPGSRGIVVDGAQAADGRGAGLHARPSQLLGFRVERALAGEARLRGFQLGDALLDAVLGAREGLVQAARRKRSVPPQLLDRHAQFAVERDLAGLDEIVQRILAVAVRFAPSGLHEALAFPIAQRGGGDAQVAGCFFDVVEAGQGHGRVPYRWSEDSANPAHCGLYLKAALRFRVPCGKNLSKLHIGAT